MNFIQQIENLDWPNFKGASLQSQELLRSLADNPRLLGQLVRNCVFNKSEEHSLLTKIILLERPSGARLQLHFFKNDYQDQPHSHSWPHSALILRGGYMHRIYTYSPSHRPQATSENLSPVRQERRCPGIPYTLEAKVCHSINVVAPTVSLIVRGPTTRNNYKFTEKLLDHEHPSDHRGQKLRTQKLRECMRWLKAEALIDG